MEHGPADGRIGVTEHSKQLLDVGQGLFFLQLALNNVPAQLLARLFEIGEVLSGQEADLLGGDVVHEGFLRRVK